MSNSKSENEKLLDHEYDGIRELDNPLPGWWLATFYITIIFAVIYFFYYQFFGGPTLDQELEAKMKSITSAREVALVTKEEKSEESFRALISDSDVLNNGKTEYIAKCVACHGNNAQGIIGPNLTDDYWINGDGTITSIIKLVNEGVPEKGMPPWKGQINPKLIEEISVYIYSLHGSNPEGAKPPQGSKVEY